MAYTPCTKSNIDTEQAEGSLFVKVLHQVLGRQKEVEIIEEKQQEIADEA